MSVPAVTIIEPVPSHFTTSNNQSYSQGIFSPAANSLIVVAVFASDTDPASPVLTDGAGNPFSTLISQRWGALSEHGFYVFYQTYGASPPATINPNFQCAGDTASGICMAAFQVTGDFVSATPFLLSATTTGTTANPTVSMGGNVSPLDAVVGGFACLRQSPGGTPPQGWTEIMDAGYTSPAAGMEAAYRTSGTAVDSSFTFTAAATTWIAWAAEINLAPVVVTPDPAVATGATPAATGSRVKTMLPAAVVAVCAVVGPIISLGVKLLLPAAVMAVTACQPTSIISTGATQLFPSIRTYGSVWNDFEDTSPAESAWQASHYDNIIMLDYGPEVRFYTANPNVKVHTYWNSQRFGRYEFNSPVPPDQWAIDNGVPLETLFLHYRRNQTGLPQGVGIIPGTDPPPVGSSAPPEDARVMDSRDITIPINPNEDTFWGSHHLNYRRWVAEWLAYKMTYLYGSFPPGGTTPLGVIDGIYIDVVPEPAGRLDDFNIQDTSEYWAQPIDDQHTHIQQQFLFVDATRQLVELETGVPCRAVANLNSVQLIYDSPWREYANQYIQIGQIEDTYPMQFTGIETGQTSDLLNNGTQPFNYERLKRILIDAESFGIERWLGFKERPNNAPVTARAQIFALGFFYLWNEPNLAFSFSNFNWVRPQAMATYAWVPAAEFDLGAPIVNSFGPLPDYRGRPGTDSHFTLASQTLPTGAGGSNETHFLLAREYEHGMVVVHCRPSNSTTLKQPSAVQFTFASPLQWDRLNADGSVSILGTSVIELKANEAIILIRPASLAPITLVPSPVAATCALPAVTLDLPLTLDPDPVPATTATADPLIILAGGADIVVTPGPVITRFAVPVVTTVRGGVTRLPGAVAAACAAVSPVVARGGVTVTPSPVSVTMVVPPITVSTETGGPDMIVNTGFCEAPDGQGHAEFEDG